MRKINDEGFSLLELVVAVGVLLVMTAGGLVAYRTITNNARTAAVEKAAKEVINKAQMNLTEGHSPSEVQDEWNNTRQDESIAVSLVEDGSCLRVVASHEAGNTAEREAGCSDDGGVITPPEEENNNDSSENGNTTPLCSEIDFDWQAAYQRAWDRNPPEMDPNNENTWGNWEGPTTPRCSGPKPFVPGPWNEIPPFPGN